MEMSKTVGFQSLAAVIVIGTLFGLPATGYAQDAAIVGTVTDSTGGVLPGVTITAVHEATGNTFTTVTDERGAYRLPVRVGNYRIYTQLSSFTSVSQSIQILIGQRAEVDLQMSP